MHAVIFHRKAIRAGYRYLLKSVASIAFRCRVSRSWEMTRTQFWQHQARKLREIWSFARKYVPYYRENAGAYAGIQNVSAENLLEILESLPVISKDKVKQYNELFKTSRKAIFINENTTSGTTGTPISLYVTLCESALSHVITQEWHRRICGQRSPKTVYLTGFMCPSRTAREIAWRDPLTGSLYLSIYSLKKDNRGPIADILEATKPRLIWGYASALHQLAVLLSGLSIKKNINAVGVTTSEVLRYEWKNDILENLCDKVYDNYGSMEGCHRVLECEEGHMHINPDEGIVEILDEEGNRAGEGEVGRVVVTGLTRKHTPLIRYEIGDLAYSTGYKSNCRCELRWPTIGRVLGRSDDLVIMRDGRKLGYLSFHSTKDLPEIREAQLIQKGYNEFVYVIALMNDRRIDKASLERRIVGEIERRIGERIRLYFNYVSNVPRGHNGKFKSVVVDFNDK